MNYGNNKNPAAGTGFTSTRVDWNTDVGGCRFEYKRVTATGTQAATYTGPSTDSWITNVAAFDEAAGGGGSPPDFQGFIGQPGLAQIAPPPSFYALPALIPGTSTLVLSEVRP